MNRAIFASAIVFMGLSGAAYAQGVQVCMPNNSTLNLNALTPGIEVGIVVQSVASGPSYPTVNANNYYQKGAGPGWTAPLPTQYPMANGGCVQIAIMNKPTPPGGASWICDQIFNGSSATQTVVFGQMPGTTVETGIVSAPGQATSVTLNTIACPVVP